MKLTIYSFSNKQPDWVVLAVNDYAKRFSKDFPIEIIDLKPESRQTSKPIDSLLRQEAERFINTFNKRTPKALLVVLDEKGQNWTTAQLAHFLSEKMPDTAQIAFLIGSADGIDAALKQKADQLLRLSSMTLPHGLAKVLLTEQLYRAISQINNHPYHREG